VVKIPEMKPFRNIGAVITEMRAILRRPDTVIQYRTLKTCEACATYTPGSAGIVIYIGRGRCGRIRSTIHELAHMIMGPRMNGLGMDVEEPQIVGLENEIIKRIFRSDDQIRWWLEHVHAKLPEGQKESG
jgi:hypothetical protein